MLRRKRKWNYVTYSIKLQKAEEDWKRKYKERTRAMYRKLYMVDIQLYKKITLNVSGPIALIKTDCPSGLRNKTQLDVVYKKPTLYIDID